MWNEDGWDVRARIGLLVPHAAVGAEAEIAAIEPKVILCLGATAARAVMGGKIRVTETRGVSAAKVVATIAAPASHHGTWRPDRKYSSRLSPPRFVKMKPITVDSAK